MGRTLVASRWMRRVLSMPLSTAEPIHCWI